MINKSLKRIFSKISDSECAMIGGRRNCKLCDYPSHSFANVDFNQSCDRMPIIRSNILVEYFRCQRCELLFTDFFDEWSADDFRQFIYNDDYAQIDGEYAGIRAARTADDIATTLLGLQHLRILDFGSGEGHFETELKSRGIRDVTSYDPFTSPIVPDGLFDIVTCFDVIEHSPSPQETFENLLSMLAPGGCVLIGQTLQPPDIWSLRDRWWYLAPRNGHCTTYSPETIDFFAKQNSLRFFDFGDLFALTRKEVSEASQQIIERRRPQMRRIEISAPAQENGTYASWHDAEISPSGYFRWTREARVSFGTHKTPSGSFRVIFRHFGQRSDQFLSACRIGVGDVTAPIEVHEDDVFAVVDLPFAASREITLLTPQPTSDVTMGVGADARAIGIAVAC